jgi:hypothetical protein
MEMARMHDTSGRRIQVDVEIRVFTDMPAAVVPPAGRSHRPLSI